MRGFSSLKGPLLGLMVTFAFPFQVPNMSAKVALEWEKREKGVALYLNCENLGEHPLSFRVDLRIRKEGPTGTAVLFQSRWVELGPGEKSRPFLSALSLSPKDTLGLELRVFDQRGRLLLQERICPQGGME